MRPSKKPPKIETMGEIKPDEVYPQALFCRKLGISRYLLLRMRERGLRVICDGKQRIVRGSDYFAYLDSINEA